MAEYVNSRAQACQNCVKAKAKCYGRSAGTCERCNRLGKECFMQTPVIRKRKSAKTTYQAQAERIAELEARVNSLVSDLAPSQPSKTTTPGSALVTSNTSLSAGNGSYSGGANHASMPSPVSSHSPGTDHRRAILSEKSPDDLLDIFRVELARQVPFVSIPPHVKAEAFSHEKPFTCQAIMFAASYHDSVHQMALGQEFLKNLNGHIISIEKKTLDMLQGLLIYITWYNTLFYPSTQINTLLGLVFSLVIDLYLYVPSVTPEKHEKFLDEMKGIVTCYQSSWTRAPLSREEKRAVLGCFYICASPSPIFARFNPLHWTPNIQNYYLDILNNPEGQNDIYLAHLAELTRILEDIKHAGLRTFPAHQRCWNSAIAVQFKLLTSELHRFKLSLPESLQHDVLMLTHYHAVEVALFECGFSMPPTTIVHEPTIQRADALLLCLHAIEALTDVLFSIETKPYIQFCPVVCIQIYFSLMTLSKMSLFEADDWNFSRARTSLSFTFLVKKVAQMTEDLSLKYDVSETKKPWADISKRLRLMDSRFECLMASKSHLQVSLSQPTAELGDVDFMPSFLNQFDLLDEEFWQNFTAGNNFLEGIEGNTS